MGNSFYVRFYDNEGKKNTLVRVIKCGLNNNRKTEIN